MKTHTPTPGSSFQTPGRPGWLLLLRALALSLPAQTGPEINIQSTGDTNAVLSWQDPAEEYIVVSASTLDGPWTPCLESIDRGTNVCQMAVCAPGGCKYFRLARGERFEDDFEDGDLAGWTVVTADPTAPSHLTWVVTNGHLRVYGPWPGSGLERHVFFYRTNLMLTDLTMSIDILGWGDDQSNVLLFGRLWPEFSSLPGVYSYGGGVGMQHYRYLDQSALWLEETWPGGWYTLIEPISKTDPARDYRLDFSLVGDLGTVSLWELTNGTSWLDSVQATDSSLTVGWVGFFVNVRGSDGNVDFTLDNFVAVGTTP